MHYIYYERLRKFFTASKPAASCCKVVSTNSAESKTTTRGNILSYQLLNESLCTAVCSFKISLAATDSTPTQQLQIPKYSTNIVPTAIAIVTSTLVAELVSA